MVFGEVGHNHCRASKPTAVIRADAGVSASGLACSQVDCVNIGGCIEVVNVDVFALDAGYGQLQRIAHIGCYRMTDAYPLGQQQTMYVIPLQQSTLNQSLIDASVLVLSLQCVWASVEVLK